MTRANLVKENNSLSLLFSSRNKDVPRSLSGGLRDGVDVGARKRSFMSILMHLILCLAVAVVVLLVVLLLLVVISLLSFSFLFHQD